MLLWLVPQEQPQQQQLISCLPNTGCSQTLISAEYTKQLKLQINNNNRIQLFSANGGQMQVLGSSKVIMYTKSRSIKTEALVTTNLAYPVLLSWHDLIRLKIIDEHFPQTANSVTTSTRLQILDKYPTVFKDNVDSKPMLTEKVHLFLKPNAVPYRVSAARQIPLRFREPAETCIK